MELGYKATKSLVFSLIITSRDFFSTLYIKKKKKNVTDAKVNAVDRCFENFANSNVSTNTQKSFSRLKKSTTVLKIEKFALLTSTP